MEKEGKYIYCIVNSKQERHFGPIGVGGRRDEVLTIGYEDLSMVVSNHPLTKLVVSRENMITHEKVIEEVMKEFDSVLPVRFGTIASSADEIRNLLDNRRREFQDSLKNMERKVELGVKGLWKNMSLIFKEIVEENKDIKKIKEGIQKDRKKKNIQAKMEAGKMVAQALVKKKEKESAKITDEFKIAAYDYKLNKTLGDEMFMNAAFLVDKAREKEFDNIMDELDDEHKDRVRFMYSGPFAPYNFVNIVIYPEEWEK